MTFLIRDFSINRQPATRTLTLAQYIHRGSLQNTSIRQVPRPNLAMTVRDQVVRTKDVPRSGLTLVKGRGHLHMKVINISQGHVVLKHLVRNQIPIMDGQGHQMKLTSKGQGHPTQTTGNHGYPDQNYARSRSPNTSFGRSRSPNQQNQPQQNYRRSVSPNQRPSSQNRYYQNNRDRSPRGGQYSENLRPQYPSRSSSPSVGEQSLKLDPVQGKEPLMPQTTSHLNGHELSR